MTAKDQFKSRRDLDPVRLKDLFPYLYGNIVVDRLPAWTRYKDVDQVLLGISEIIEAGVVHLMRQCEKFNSHKDTMTAFFLELITESADTADEIRHQITAEELSSGSETEHLAHEIEFYAVNIVSFKRLFYIRVHSVPDYLLLIIESARKVSVGNVVVNTVCLGMLLPELCQHSRFVFCHAVNVIHSEREPRTDADLPKIPDPAVKNVEIIADERFVIRIFGFFEHVSVFIDRQAAFVKSQTAGRITVKHLRRVNGAHKIDVDQKIRQLRTFVLTNKLSFALFGKAEALVIGLSRCPCFSDMVVGVFVEHYADMRHRVSFFHFFTSFGMLCICDRQGKRRVAVFQTLPTDSACRYTRFVIPFQKNFRTSSVFFLGGLVG